MSKAVNEGQTQVYSDGSIEPQYGINTDAPYLNNPPKQLLDLIAAFYKSGKSDSQVLAILVGMGTPQQLALSGINAFKAATQMYTTENNQKNHNNMKFTLVGLYENVMKAINALNEMGEDKSRVSYSAKNALGILESSLGYFPMRFSSGGISIISEDIENNVNPALKYKIAKTLHRDLSSSEWLNPVRELRSYIMASYDSSKWSFRIAEAIERTSAQKGKLYEGLTNQLESLLKESSEDIKSKFTSIAVKNPWSAECKNILNEMASSDKKAYSNNGGKIGKILSPVLESEEGLTFHLHGKNYIFNEGKISETEVKDSRFFDVLEGLKMFKLDGSSLVTFSENGKTLEYNIEEGTLSLGGVDLTNASIVELKESLIATRFFGYRDQWKTDNVCKFFENVDLLHEMDNFTGITSTEFLNLFLTVIAVEEGVWVNKVNLGMQINEMKFYSSATEVVKMIKEFINYDASSILSERLVAEGNQKAITDKKRNEINDRISFLEEKKGSITEAINKLGNSEELQEALKLINTEITKFEKELQETYSIVEKKTKNQYLDNGFVEATIENPVSGFKVDTQVYVNAEEYASLGDNDLLTFVDPKNDKEHIAKKKDLKVKL
jgi:hypothetical protein